MCSFMRDMAEYSLEIRRRGFRNFNNGPGRVPEKREEILEDSSQKAFAS
jgi:hypothetical protein